MTVSIMFTLRSGSYYCHNALPLSVSPPGAIACALFSPLGVGDSRRQVVIILNFILLLISFSFLTLDLFLDIFLGFYANIYHLHMFTILRVQGFSDY